MPTLDIFNQDAFSLSSLTARVNNEEAPYVPGQLGKVGVFEESGVTTTTVMVESRNGKLALIEPSPRGGPGQTVGSEKDQLRPFMIPHFQRDDAILADEVQNKRAFGKETDVESVLSVVDRKVNRHLTDLDMTVEHGRIGCIKGIVVSGKGTVLANLYTAFDIAAPAPIVMNLGVDTTIARKASEQVVRIVEDELDAPYTGIHALCGNDYWDAMVNHKSIREVFLAAQKAAELLNQEATTFKLGGITYERYRTGKKATAANGGAGYIAADEARVFPVGVPQLFITRFAPADYMETVNTEGLPRYVKQVRMPNDKGVSIEVQSNHISLCTQPGVLRTLKIAA